MPSDTPPAVPRDWLVVCAEHGADCHSVGYFATQEEAQEYMRYPGNMRDWHGGSRIIRETRTDASRAVDAVDFSRSIPQPAVATALTPSAPVPRVGEGGTPTCPDGLACDRTRPFPECSCSRPRQHKQDVPAALADHIPERTGPETPRPTGEACPKCGNDKLVFRVGGHPKYANVRTCRCCGNLFAVPARAPEEAAVPTTCPDCNHAWSEHEARANRPDNIRCMVRATSRHGGLDGSMFCSCRRKPPAAPAVAVPGETEMQDQRHAERTAKAATTSPNQLESSSARDALLRAINQACAIIEMGDQRLLASDGPAGNQPPDLTLAEWCQLYTTLDDARRFA